MYGSGDLLVVLGIGRFVEDGDDFCRGSLRKKGDDHRAEHAGDEAGEQLIDTGGGGQKVVPEDIDDRTADDTGNGAPVVEPLPEDGEQDDGTEGGTEEAPGVLDEFHDGLCAFASGAGEEVRKDEDATSSWESAVDMDAAMMAASRMPDRNGGKKRLARWMKTVA